MSDFNQLMDRAHEIQRKSIDLSIKLYYAESNDPGQPSEPSTDIENFFRNEFAQVPDLFTPFSQMPDPASYDPVIADLGAVQQQLSDTARPTTPGGSTPGAGTSLNGTTNPQLRTIEFVAKRLAEWHGAGANAFQMNFIEPFPAIVDNQSVVIAALKGSLEAHQGMWREARTNIVDIADQTIKQLDQIGGCTWGRTTQVMLTVLAAIGTIGGATTWALEAGFKILASAAQAGASLIPLGGQTAAPIDYGHPREIIATMKTAMDRLARDVAAAETDIGQILSAAHNTVVTASPGKFVAPRPSLASLPHDQLTSNEYGLGSAAPS